MHVIKYIPVVISMEQPRAVLDVVRAVLAAAGAAPEVDVQGTAVHELPHQALRCDRARAELGFAPQVAWEEALDRTVAWYRRALAGG